MNVEPGTMMRLSDSVHLVADPDQDILSLEVPAGADVRLLGFYGTGKSTTSQLLLGSALRR